MNGSAWTSHIFTNFYYFCLLLLLPSPNSKLFLSSQKFTKGHLTPQVWDRALNAITVVETLRISITFPAKPSWLFSHWVLKAGGWQGARRILTSPVWKVYGKNHWSLYLDSVFHSFYYFVWLKKICVVTASFANEESSNKNCNWKSVSREGIEPAISEYLS